MTYPDPDAIEQATPADPADEDDSAGEVPESFGIEVPEADALEQSQEVRTEDDYD